MSGAAWHLIRDGKPSPRVIHRDDGPINIQKRNVGGKRVKDGSLLGDLAFDQLLLGTPQQERAAFPIQHHIHLTGGQFLQAPAGLQQLFD
jgi:hypothetical protein